MECTFEEIDALGNKPAGFRISFGGDVWVKMEDVGHISQCYFNIDSGKFTHVSNLVQLKKIKYLLTYSL